jgi:GntR family transcriptional regulator
VIRIDLDDPKPLEEQIVAALRQALARGTLGSGDELPSVRQVAGDLGVHWNTVARAYRRLADEGLLVVRRGRGALVRGPRRKSVRATTSTIRERFDEAIATGLLGGLSRREISETFEEALGHFAERSRT